MVMRQHPGGRLLLEHGRQRSTLGDDDLFLVAPHQSSAAHWVAMNISPTGLSGTLLDEVAALLTGHRGAVTFAMGAAMNRASRGHWLQVQRFVTRNLNNPSVADSPLARRELVRLLNGATLACFSSSSHASGPDDEPSPCRPTVPASLRRAVDHIEQHAEAPVELSDLCAAARLSPGARQEAFRRHLGTTPLGHVRSVRLERIHQQLQSADPGDGQTVAAIATHWGITHLGRFAQEYRSRYGSTLSNTLRSTNRPG